MKLAVMQPYFFPYLGYYQLARSVDRFVFLDDVAYIKSGFINRNRILLDGQPFQFTLPVANTSQNRLINAHEYTGEFRRFLAHVRHGYGRATFFDDVYPRIEALVLDPDLNVARKNAGSLRLVFDYLGLPLADTSSSRFDPGAARGQERILLLCRQHGATAYHNPQGGQALYDAGYFASCDIHLRFMRNRFPEYAQPGTSTFHSGLSVIDVLMHVPPPVVRDMLDAYDLAPPAQAPAPLAPTP